MRERVVNIAFDGGDTTEKAPVILAEARLARMLLDAGVDVRLLRISSSNGSKVGLDDHLVTQGDARCALQGLLSAALDAEPLARVRSVGAGNEVKHAALQLLQDLSFVASLHVADKAVVDVVARELKRLSGITKTAVEQAIDRFRTALGPGSSTSEAKQAIPADPAITAEAEALLRDPKLTERFLRDVAADGLVGEGPAALTVLLVAVSRQMARPLHLVVKAPSSAGKNEVVKSVLRYLPEDDVIEVDDMSPRALQYLPSALTGKVVYIVEQEGAARAEYPLRVAMSEGCLSVLVAEKVDGRIATRKHTVEGPASFITTTTRGLLHDENETRILEITVDESQAQTQRILRAQARIASHPLNEREREVAKRRQQLWRMALGALKPSEVSIPNAERLSLTFPSRRLRARRDFRKFLGIIKAHALLHQHQRVRCDGSIVATNDDIDAARELCQSLWSDVPLRLAKVAEKLREAFGRSPFTATKAAGVAGNTADAMRRLMHNLEDCGLLELVSEAGGVRAATYALTEPPLTSRNLQCIGGDTMNRSAPVRRRPIGCDVG